MRGVRGVSGDEKPSVLRSRRTRRRRRRMKKFLRAHRPRNQSKMVQEILADLKKIHVSLMMMTIQVKRAG